MVAGLEEGFDFVLVGEEGRLVLVSSRVVSVGFIEVFLSRVGVGNGVS